MPSLPELSNGDVTVRDAGVLSDYTICHRQDASGILEADGVHYVYYAACPAGWQWEQKRDIPFFLDVQCASSMDGGESWTEHGPVLPRGDESVWHAHMRHAPHVVRVDGTYYMYFCYWHHDEGTKNLALARSDDPLGPFRVDESGPKLRPGASFDSALVDDPCVIRYQGTWHMYYKGRPVGTDPVDSCVCLARAESVEGPWQKHPAGALFPCHTANVWPHREGVAAIAATPNFAILYAPDGVDFRTMAPTSVELRDGGTFCPDAVDNDGYGRGVRWGLFMDTYDPPEGKFARYLRRWFLDMRV